METKSLVGSMLGNRFLIKNVLEGGMGAIFLVQDRNSELLVLKTVKIQEQDLIRRFLTEAKTISFIRSDFVVESKEIIREVDLFSSTIADDVQWKHGIYSKLREHDNLFILMEYCDGGNLRSRISKKALSLDEFMSIAAEFCYGMIDCQHEIPGLVHRDLKPENLLFLNNRLKIADFGLVRQERHLKILSESPKSVGNLSSSEIQSEFGNIAGTIPYMSPEQISGQGELGLASDIFAYGLILFEMYTGHQVLTGNFSKIQQNLLSASPLPSIMDVSNIDPRIGRIIDKCLAKNPSQRPQDWREVLEMWGSSTIPIGKGIKKDASRLGFYPTEELVIFRWNSLLPDDSEMVELFKVNLKPANVLRKVHDLFNLRQDQEAIDLVDDTLGITHLRNNQQKLYIYLKELNANQDMFKKPSSDLVMNIGPFIESLIDVRSRCYASHIDDIWQQNIRAGKFDLHDNFSAEAKVNAYVAADLFPNNSDMLVLAAEIFMITADFDVAERYLGRALSISPESKFALGMDNELWSRKALYYSQVKGNVTEAIKCFDHLIANDPKDARAWFNKGVILLGTKRKEEALEVLWKAHELGHPGAAGLIKEITGKQATKLPGISENDLSLIETALTALMDTRSSSELITIAQKYPFILTPDFLDGLKSMISEMPVEHRQNIQQRYDFLVELAREIQKRR